MKKLESLSNSLYEKFDNKKINNLAAITGGCTIATCNNGKDDEFSDINTSSSSMAYGGYSDIKGDMCQGLSTGAGNGGSGSAGPVGHG